MPQGRFLATDIEPAGTVAPPPRGRFSAADIEPPASTPVDLSLLEFPGQRPRRPIAPSPEPDGRLGGRVADTIIDVLTSGAEGVLGAGQSAIGLADLATGGHAGDLVRGLGLDLEGMQERNRAFRSPERQEADRAVDAAEGPLATLRAVAENPSVIPHAIIKSVAPMLAGAGVARGISAAVPWLARAAPFIGEGIVGAGSTAEQVERETGGLSLGQTALSTASGAATGLLGALGGRVAQKLGIADVDVILAGGGAPQQSRRFASAVVLSALEEGVIEELPQSVQEQVLLNLARDRPLSEGVDTAAVLGALTGAAMGGGAAVATRPARPTLPVTPRALEPPAGETPAPPVEPPAGTPPVDGAPVVPPVDPAGAQPTTGQFRPEDIELEGVLRPQLPITLRVDDDITAPAAIVDRLDTGELQPRLPGDVGAVREQNVATPEIDMPFSLSRETGEARAGAQTGLFGAGDVDTVEPPAQTTTHEPSRSGTGEEAGAGGDAAVLGVTASVPPHSRESPAQSERRRVAHYVDVFGHVLARAREVDPAVDEADLRAEFDERLTFIDELDEEYRKSGSSPRDLLEAIAASGGISLDAEDSGGMGLIGELRRLREGDATGPFGTFGGVPHVFRARSRNDLGKHVAGHPLDVIVQALHQRPGEFTHIRDTNDLLEALDDIARMGDVGARGATFPGTKELGRRAGMRAGEAWWADTWRTAPAAAEEQPTVHKFSSTQFDLPANIAEEVRAVAAMLPDDDLAGDGRETQPHVTVKYGLHTTDAEAVRKALADQGPVTLTLGKTSVFEGVEDGTADAVKVDVVDSPELHALNAKIAAALEHTDSHPDYKPHVTLAYVKPGLGQKYVGGDMLAGRTLTLSQLTFSSKTGDMVTIPLAGKPAAATPQPQKKPKKRNKGSSGTASSAILPVSTGNTRDLPTAPVGKAPIPVTPRMRQSDIIEQMRALIDDIPVSVGHFRHRAYGIYKIKEQAIRLKVANNVSTFFHEAGHHIDENVLGITRTDPRWEDELLAIGAATSRDSYSKTQKLQEGAAEFLRWWFTEPHIAKARAPHYTAEFESRLDQRPNWRDQLLEVRENLQGLISQNPATRGRLRINREKPSRFPVLAAAAEDPRAAIRAVAARAVDDLLPLRVAVDAMAEGRPVDTRLNAHALARIARGAAGKAEAFLEHGVRGRDGKFIGPALRDILRPVKGELQALGDYLVARRAMELHGRGIEPGMPVTEARGIIEETEARDDIEALDKAADEIYEFQDAVLEYARLYGSMSREQIALIKKVNESYVPMQRAFDAAEGSVRGIARRIAGRELPIKRIKGSGRDIIDPFESIITNTFAMVDMVEKNRAMQALVRQAEDTPDSARWLEKIPTPQVATRFRLDQVAGAIQAALREAGVGEIDPKILEKGFSEAIRGVTEPSVIDVAGNAAKAGIKAVAPVPDNLTEFLDEMVTVWTPQTFARGDEQIVTVLRNGKREFWQVQEKALYDAITVIGPRTTSSMMQLLGGPTRLLRAAATLTPGFIVRNPGRDTLVAYMQSRYGFVPVYDTVRGLIAQVRGDADAELFYTSGIAQASMAAQYRQQRQEAVAQLRRGDGLRGVVFHPIDLLRAFSAWMETATRLGEFKLALDAGGEERGIWQRLLAASQVRPQVREETLVRGTLAARDVTTDFARGGSITKEINEAWAFFNARVQGYVRMTEAIQRDPVGVGLKAASLALFSAALWALNADDEEYQEKEAWEKKTYWHLKLGPDGVTVGGRRVKWLRIPKPFEYGYAADVMEAALDYARKGDATRFREMKETLIGTNPKQLIVSLMPTAVLPLLEAGINYSSFRDTHIVRPWDMDLESDLQYTEWTSETAKQLGKVLPVSPAILDHVLYGYTAGFGRGVVGGMDTGLEALGAVPRKGLPQRPVQQLPVVGVFTDAGGYSGGAQSIQDIYDLADRFASAEESVRTDIKRGDRASADARLARAREALPWERRDSILEARKALKELGPSIKAIYAAPPAEMSPEQKRVRIDAVRAEMVDISRRALGRTPLRRKAP